jgi:8-oxo-dGTP pyrophosphatase MutT (NUDIX family)
MVRDFPVYMTADGEMAGWFEPASSPPAHEEVIGVVVLPFLDSHRVLIVNVRKRHSWEFPGGHVEESEGNLAAARREAREECGVELGELHLIGRKWLRLLDQQRAELRRYDGRCLLVYWADVVVLHEVLPNGEIGARRVVKTREAGKVLGGHWPSQHLVEILEHAISERRRWDQQFDDLA